MFSILKTRHLSIIMKILAVFLLVFFPLYISSMVMYFKGANNIKAEISKSASFQVEYYLKNIETEILHIYEMQGLYMGDRDFVKLATLYETMNSSERIQVIKNIQDKLNSIKNLSANILEVKAYFPNINFEINGSGNILELDKAQLYEKLMAVKFPLIKQDGRLFLNPMSSSFSRIGKLPMVNISVELSIRHIEQTLLDFVQYKKGGAVMVGLDQDWMISNSINEQDKLFENEVIRSYSFKGNEGNINTLSINNEKYMTLYKKSEYLKAGILVYIDEKEILGSLVAYRTWIWAISIMAFIEIIIFSYLIYRLIKNPLDKLLTAFRRADEGMLDISIENKNNDEFRYIYSHFNRMIVKVKELINQMYEQKILVKNAELKQLQSQINSHFLYNSLFIISRLIKMEDIENASHLTHHLALFYQFNTRNTFDFIPLQKEISHVRSYMEIQSFRFSDRISYRFDDIQEHLSDIMIPRLILQPLIENCYLHGLKNKTADGMIHVGITRDCTWLYITVEDNGEEMEDERLARLQGLTSSNGNIDGEVTGLLNIHKRIRIKYGEKSGLFFSRSKYGGLCAKIKLLIGDDANNVPVVDRR